MYLSVDKPKIGLYSVLPSVLIAIKYSFRLLLISFLYDTCTHPELGCPGSKYSNISWSNMRFSLIQSLTSLLGVPKISKSAASPLQCCDLLELPILFDRISLRYPLETVTVWLKWSLMGCRTLSQSNLRFSCSSSLGLLSRPILVAVCDLQSSARLKFLDNFMFK